MQGFVPAGEKPRHSSTILRTSEEEADLLNALKGVSTRYQSDDFNIDVLRNHIEHDIAYCST